MSTEGEVVRRFLDLLAERRAEEAIALLADDVVWRNTRMPTMRGRRVVGMLRDMERRRIGFRVDMHHLAADGPIVLTERTDHLSKGRWRSSFWVCGTFEVHDGRITLWDDHFSMGDVVGSSLLGLARMVTGR